MPLEFLKECAADTHGSASPALLGWNLPLAFRHQLWPLADPTDGTCPLSPKAPRIACWPLASPPTPRPPPPVAPPRGALLQGGACTLVRLLGPYSGLPSSRPPVCPPSGLPCLSHLLPLPLFHPHPCLHPHSAPDSSCTHPQCQFPSISPASHYFWAKTQMPCSGF